MVLFVILKAQYNATMQMSSPTGDNYVNNYYHQGLNYPGGFFDASAWSSSSADASLSYLGNYNQQMGATDYMQFPGYDYSATFWPYNPTPDYSSWSAPPQQDPMKMADGQAYIASMDPAYTEAYTVGQQKHPVVANGVDVSVVSAAINESDDVSEIEQGIQMVSVNGHGELTQDSPSETSVHDSAISGNVNNSSVLPAPASGQPKTLSWANIAKQPAKPTPIPPKILTRPSPQPKVHPENSWDSQRAPRGSSAVTSQGQSRGSNWSAPRSNRAATAASGSDRPSQRQNGSEDCDSDPTLSKLKQSNSYNPKTFDVAAKNARFFVIKSYSEDDIHRAIKYGVWCSTEHGNKRLDAAFKEREGKGPIFLFYSVNGSGHFCGMAEMKSGVDYQTHVGVWTQDKWKGSMEIKWIYVKDVPNGQLRHIRLENNENKPVTNSRDTQEVPPEKGRQVLKVIHSYRHNTSIFDDFGHYEKKEEEEGGDPVADKKKSSPKLAVSAFISFNTW